MKKLIGILLVALLLTGCAATNAATGDDGESDNIDVPTTVVTSKNIDLSTFSGTVEIANAGTYTLTGTLSDGGVLVTAPKDTDVTLILSNADITNGTGAAIYATKCNLTVTLADGTANTLTDGGANYVYAKTDKEEPCAALFAKNNMTVNGTGALTVNAGFRNGIHAKDDLVIDGGVITVYAVKKGLKGGDTLTVNGGDINITQSYEGIESETVTITGGKINIVSSDDGINAAGESGTYTINISGGDISILAGGDGLDSNGALNISGGRVVSIIGENSHGDEALDADGSINITGGTVIFGGVSTGIPSSTASTQSYVVVQNAAAGAEITVRSDGAVLASYTPNAALRYVAISAPAITAGTSYDIYVNGVLSATATGGVGGTGMGGGFGDRPNGGNGGFGGGTRPDFNGEIPDFNGETPDFGDRPAPPDGNFGGGTRNGRGEPIPSAPPV
ncbi:MAG: carbohydrate-binding domain-containing protein [Oscillospiraceae bacterium]|jgi:hypothetical protein|nr:carbohydrate-binding domain-containing protein [Oscillospiraceae bacterium]